MWISSVQNGRVKAVVKLRSVGGAGGRRGTGLFLAEGVREVTRAAEAGLRISELWLCPALLEARGVWLPGVDAERVYETTPEVFGKLTYLNEPEGVLAVVRAPAWATRAGAESLAGVELGDDPLVLIAVGTQKPGNLGAMVRSAAAAGCGVVLAVERMGAEEGESEGGQEGAREGGRSPVDPLNPNAIRASTAAVLALPTLVVGEAEALAWVRARGLRLAAAAVEGGTPHHDADLTGPLAIAVGPEDAALSPAWLAAADEGGVRGGARRGVRVSIPMCDTGPGAVVDSLNASVAAGILLFEARRQRTACGR